MLADHKCYQHFLAESIAPLLAHYANKFNYFLVFAPPATTFGKNILPRLAGKLNVEQISDVIAILDRKTYQRPIYAGNAIATLSSQDSIQVLTVRATAFPPPMELGEKSAPIEQVGFALKNDLSIFINEEDYAKDRPELTLAKILISGERGLKHKENFERLVKIADRLGAAVGASWTAVDAESCAHLMIFKSVKRDKSWWWSPMLYLAVGISGSHSAFGEYERNSKIIVAINKKTPTRPYFKLQITA
ncbi:electron transfer flavoprotein subunit alpha/FixB family protein [Coxiella-like endosymbiont]|uniref:electron transfer flavoprotein subunit alpha/FixB family protein n=1 Tax=Coxiella-like endosymbiont TaxID=1592897 RepID=UPI00272CD0DA|nr:FAD-binding protein [Coxiella-like endosymbiont]